MGLTPNLSASERIVRASTPAASAIAMAPRNTRSRLSGTGLRASAPILGDIALPLAFGRHSIMPVR
jgi:hypothetical protein